MYVANFFTQGQVGTIGARYHVYTAPAGNHTTLLASVKVFDCNYELQISGPASVMLRRHHFNSLVLSLAGQQRRGALAPVWYEVL